MPINTDLPYSEPKAKVIRLSMHVTGGFFQTDKDVHHYFLRIDPARCFRGTSGARRDDGALTKLEELYLHEFVTTYFRDTPPGCHVSNEINKNCF